LIFTASGVYAILFGSVTMITHFLWKRYLVGGKFNEKDKNRTDRHRSQSR